MTILETGKALADEDPELADILLVQLAREGIVLRENVEIVRVEPRGPGVRVILAGKTLEEAVDGSHLLIAAGRMPNVEGLGLEAAGVAFDKSGITLGRNLRSSNRRVYAVGDVGGAPFSAHAATLSGGPRAAREPRSPAGQDRARSHPAGHLYRSRNRRRRIARGGRASAPWDHSRPALAFRRK